MSKEERSPLKVDLGLCDPFINKKRKKVADEEYHKRIKLESKTNISSSFSLKNLSKCNNYFPLKETLKTAVDTDCPQISKSSSSCQLDLLACDKENQSHLGIPNMDSVNNLASILDIDFEEWEDETTCESDVDLSQPHRCKICDIRHNSTKVELTLKSILLNKKVLCILEGFWVYTNLNVGNIVSITCKNVKGNWVINNNHGLLVLEPDFLLPTTSVVGSLWCKRKSALSVKFKGYGGSNEYMLIGSIVHSVFQSALEKNILDAKVIEEMINNIVTKEYVTKSLFECNVSLAWAKNEANKYIPKIQDFINTYRNNSKPGKNDNWKGVINTIEDIEENIWCPDLGIKGKIDVTVRANNQLMPLEVKTGKASMSLEHRGQVTLYLMMMKKIGYDVSSGLLLYLKEGVLKEITTTEKEERDLIHLRNELVYYTMQQPEIIDENKMLLKLPEPINHSSCKTCSFKNICVVYAHCNNENFSSTTLRQIQKEVLEYLSETHISYFMKWSCLNIIESMANVSTRDMKEIYLTTPDEREKNGKCISNLRLTKVIRKNEEDSNSEHFFEKDKDCLPVNLLTKGIFENEYVIISTTKRHAISAGFVTNVTTTSITVTAERKIGDQYRNELFTIDSWSSELSQGYNLNNLALLLDPTPKSEILRSIIIDKKTPTFKATLPKEIGVKGKSILRRLNKVQQKAVLKAIAANDYFLIKGMPGTGKTTTIVALIQLFYELKKSVLITSHTNSAVDNVCLKLLKYGVKFLRLGSISKIHKDLQEYSEHNLTKDCTSPEEFEEVYNNVQIIATTCMSSGHPALTKRTLDVCIVDESTQVSQSSIIRPLYCCNTFILIGDQDQLPAVIRSRKARSLGMSESLFERLYSDAANIALNINYRMNSKITNLANTLTYKNELKVGSEKVANSTLTLSNENTLHEIYGRESWVMKALDGALDQAVQLIDTGPVWDLIKEANWKVNKKYGKDNSSNVNIHEAAVVFVLVRALLDGGVDPEDVGVIASYRHQVEQIASIIKDVDVNTVDQFQGKDKSVIIYSSGVSKDVSVFKIPDSEDILEDKRRLNVAVTRAKRKLIIIGDVNTLKTYSSFKEIVRWCEDVTVRICEFEGFSWESLLGKVQLSF